MKTCSICGEEKSLSEFHRWRRARDGHRAQCKACVVSYARERYATDSEYRAKKIAYENARARELYKNDPAYRLRRCMRDTLRYQRNKMERHEREAENLYA